MASKRRNMFHKNKTQETTEEATGRFINMIHFDKIPGQVGFLAMTDDGAVLASGGELENNENVANVISGLISLSSRLGLEGESYKKLSITFKDSSYVICLSNKTLYIVKQRFEPPCEDSNDDSTIPPVEQNNVVVA